MPKKISPTKWLLSFTVLCVISGCAILPPSENVADTAVYLHKSKENSLFERYAPILIVEESNLILNKIGFPSFRKNSSGEFEAFIDTERPAFFTLKQDFTISGKQFSNLIYRIHFPETPLPHLTSGKNVGLLVYITINEQNKPVLVTTLHTCGCYMAIIPTNHYDLNKVPKWWDLNNVYVYGENLPGLLKTAANEIPQDKLFITLRGATHRVKEIAYKNTPITPNNVQHHVSLEPMEALDKLPADSTTLSFFETEGRRKGYVKGSYKHLEMLFMSWWAIDPYVGVDKALGPENETGSIMYTSLKFWDRRKSNIWNFPTFLEYWGWDLN